MTGRYKSKPMAALHETMSDLHLAGAIDSGIMSEFDQRCLADAANDLSFQVFKDAKGEWRWRLVAANGRRIAGGWRRLQIRIGLHRRHRVGQEVVIGPDSRLKAAI